MASALRFPIVMCGKSPKVGLPAAQNLSPELETIAFITSVSDGIKNLPSLIAGSAPPALPADDGGVATRNFSAPPKAIVFGGAFTEDMIEEMRKACEHVKPGIPWLSRGADASDRFPSPMEPENYAKAVAEAVKATVAKLEAEGKLEADGLYHW